WVIKMSDNPASARDITWLCVCRFRHNSTHTFGSKKHDKRHAKWATKQPPGTPTVKQCVCGYAPFNAQGIFLGNHDDQVNREHILQHQKWFDSLRCLTVSLNQFSYGL